MKKQLFPLVVICALLSTQIGMAFSFRIGISNLRPAAQNKQFKRIYNNSTVNKLAHRSKTSDNISITYDDFVSHLDFNKSRIAMASDKPLRMDIGAIDSGVKETWVLPDFSKADDFTSIVQHQVEAAELDLYDKFGYGTHGIYSDQKFFRNDLYELSEEKLFFIAYEELENNLWEQYHYEQLKAPIPIELGTEFTSVVQFSNDDIEPSKNYTEYTDTYNVIGQGTLKTFDDGESDAMKLIYKEETREFENGEEISYSERYELVFYSKKGHYVIAAIDDPNIEGLVDLKSIQYQKLKDKNLSVNDFSQNETKTFPNPIAAGETLTIQSKSELGSYSVDFYNIYGQHIKVPSQYENGSKKLQLKIPSDLTKGFYIYKIKSQDGSVVTNGKIQVL